MEPSALPGAHNAEGTALNADDPVAVFEFLKGFVSDSPRIQGKHSSGVVVGVLVIVSYSLPTLPVLTRPILPLLNFNPLGKINSRLFEMLALLEEAHVSNTASGDAFKTNGNDSGSVATEINMDEEEHKGHHEGS